jgi:hypothetical protein
MHALTSLSHEGENGGNNGRRCYKHARIVLLPDLDSKNNGIAEFLMVIDV